MIEQVTMIIERDGVELEVPCSVECERECKGRVENGRQMEPDSPESFTFYKAHATDVEGNTVEIELTVEEQRRAEELAQQQMVARAEEAASGD